MYQYYFYPYFSISIILFGSFNLSSFSANQISHILMPSFCRTPTLFYVFIRVIPIGNKFTVSIFLRFYNALSNKNTYHFYSIPPKRCEYVYTTKETTIGFQSCLKQQPNLSEISSYNFTKQGHAESPNALFSRNQLGFIRIIAISILFTLIQLLLLTLFQAHMH